MRCGKKTEKGCFTVFCIVVFYTNIYCELTYKGIGQAWLRDAMIRAINVFGNA